MSTEDKSPVSPTKSDESPKNTIRVIKTSDSEQTLVEVKVAGESGTKVTVFGGDGPKTESKTNHSEGETEDKQPEVETKTENKTIDKEPTKNETKDVGGTKEKENKNEEKEKKEKENNEEFERLKPLTKEEVDKIVSKYKNKQDLDKYLEFFWSVDEFGFGVFTIHQLTYRLWKMGRYLADQEIAMMFADLDHDQDRLVSLDEFLDEMYREKRKPRTDEEWQALFERCDKNHDGFVCFDDIAALLRENAEPYLESQIIMFLYKHTGSEKKLDFHNFRRVLKRV